MSSTDWEDASYQKNFHDARRALLDRRRREPEFGPEQLRSILHHLYIQDGQDQFGRGRLQDIFLAATIAAHEEVLAEWERRPMGGE